MLYRMFAHKHSGLTLPLIGLSSDWLYACHKAWMTWEEKKYSAFLGHLNLHMLSLELQD